MKITLLMTPRLIMICTVCSVLLIALLVMLGFELGHQSAKADYEARLQATPENKSAVTYSPVVMPNASSVMYNATAPGKGK
jgi:hypothetical protein